MPENWPAIAADVTAALAEVGFAATLIRANTGPATPWDTTPVVAGTLVQVTVVRDDWTQRQVDGTLIRADDQWFIMDASAEPREDDRMTVQGVALRVVRSKPLNPGGVALMYEVQARRP